jgi:enoyl-CoA hydratase/carnithine racemase
MPESALQKSEVVTWEESEDGVLTIVLDRLPANALGPAIIDGLNAALDHADVSPTVRAIVVASRVPGFFAAGADIKHMGTVGADAFADYGRALREPLARLASTRCLAIAAVDGLALGGGLELALACTLRVGSTRAAFGLPEVKLGLIPGAGGTQRLPRLIGRGRALDMMLTARTVDAPEAYTIGLIDRLVEDGRAEQEARALASELRRLSQPALHAVIRTVNAAADLPLREGLIREATEEHALFERGEAREGIAAFLEKRPPRFA